MITATELASLRDTADDTLTAICTIQRRTLTSDGMGGWTESWANTYTNVACRVDAERAGPELSADGRIVSVEAYLLTVKYNQDIQPEDRIVYGTDNYEIEGVLDAHTWVTVKRASLKRLE